MKGVEKRLTELEKIILQSKRNISLKAEPDKFGGEQRLKRIQEVIDKVGFTSVDQIREIAEREDCDPEMRRSLQIVSILADIGVIELR